MLFSWNPNHKLMAIETHRLTKPRNLSHRNPWPCHHHHHGNPPPSPPWTHIWPIIKTPPPSTTTTATPNSTTMNPQKKSIPNSNQMNSKMPYPIQPYPPLPLSTDHSKKKKKNPLNPKLQTCQSTTIFSPRATTTHDPHRTWESHDPL